MMREPDDSFFDPAESVDVPNLSEHAAQAPLEVRAEAHHEDSDPRDGREVSTH